MYYKDLNVLIFVIYYLHCAEWRNKKITGNRSVNLIVFTLQITIGYFFILF